MVAGLVAATLTGWDLLGGSYGSFLKTDVIASSEGVQLLQLSKITSVSSTNPGGNSPGNLNYGISIWTGDFPTPYTECGHLNDAGLWENRNTCSGGIAIGAADAIGAQTLTISGVSKEGKNVSVNINVSAVSNVNTNMRLYVDDLGATYHCRSDHDYSVFKYEGACDLTAQQALVSAHRVSTQNTASCGNNICQTGENSTVCATDCPADFDYDGILDATDNCMYASNSDQKDTDGDKIGDKCDSTPYPACTGFYLATDKSSYTFSESIKLTYTCASPTNGVPINVKIQVISPSPASTVTTLTTLTSTTSTGIQTLSGITPKMNGSWMIRTCTNEECGLGYSNSILVTITGSSTTDTDKDGVMDNTDNCIEVANSDQKDTDGDGIGKMCDAYEPETSSGTTGSTGSTSATTSTQQCVTNNSVNDMVCTTCSQGSKTSSSYCSVSYSYTIKNVYFRKSNDMECASFYDPSGYLRTEWCYSNASEYPDDYFTKNAYCEFLQNSDGTQCQKCSYQDGTQIKNTCTATTGSNNTGTTNNNTSTGTTLITSGTGSTSTTSGTTTSNNTSNTSTNTGSGTGSTSGTISSNNTSTIVGTTTITADGTATTNYYGSAQCESYEADGLQCNVCYDDKGVKQNDSCWMTSTSSSGSMSSNSCDYFWQDGLQCMKCYDNNGTVTNRSCWQDSADDDSYNSNEEYFDLNAHCEYENTGGYFWCETCTKPDGTVLKNTCDDQEGDWDDGDDSEQGRCDYYVDRQGLECKTCYDEKGNYTTQYCEEPDQNRCEWNDEDGDGVWCEICKDDKGNVQSGSCDQQNDGNLIDPEEAGRQLSEMKEGLRWKERDLKYFGQFSKRIERKIKDFEDRIEFVEQDEMGLEQEGLSPELLDEVKGEFEEDIAALEELLLYVQEESEAFSNELEAQNDLLTYLKNKKDLTWDHLDAAVLILRKTDVYQMKRDIVEGKLSFYDNVTNILEWKREKNKLFVHLDAMNIELESQDERALTDALDWLDEFYQLYDEFLISGDALESGIEEMPTFSTIDELTDSEERQTVRSYFDEELNEMWADLGWTREDFAFHSQDNSLLWEALGPLHRLQNSLVQSQWIEEELVVLQDEIEVIEAAVDVLNGRLDKKNQNFLNEISKVMPDAREMLEDMQSLLDDFNGEPYELEKSMEHFWNQLDKWASFIDPKIEKISLYVNGHQSGLTLTDREWESVWAMFAILVDDSNEFYGSGPDCGRNCNRLQQIYGQNIADELVSRITESLLEDIVRVVKAAVMEELVKFLEIDLTEKLTNRLMENFQNLAQGEALLENNNLVFEQVTALDFEQIENENTQELETLSEFKELFANLPYPDEDLAAEIADQWESINNTLNEETSKAELQTYIDDLQKLLEQAEQSKFEYGYEFHDVPYIFNDAYNASPAEYWYAGHVIESAQEGILGGYKDGNGNRTYNFGPSDGTRRAEVLKMALFAFDYEVAGEGGEVWWTPYENKAKALNLSIAYSDLSQMVNRAEMMQLMLELGQKEGMEPPTVFEGYFPDVAPDDAYWHAAEALYAAGIIEGQGDTGNADLYNGLNRAETSTIIQRVQDWKETNELFESSEEISFEKQGLYASLVELIRAIF